MGIFTRFRDIISSNINAMLDRAEDPEKLIKLMIREMEDTLVEIKSSCAGLMAKRKTLERQFDAVKRREKAWKEKAALAVDKGRDDLAREALVEKRRYARKAEAVARELAAFGELEAQYKADIRQLEDKLRSAREKQGVLVQRHIHAQKKIQAEEEIRRMDSADAVFRFNQFEKRIERLESEADLVNWGKQTPLEAAFDHLTVDEEIESELAALKQREKTNNTEMSA